MMQARCVPRTNAVLPKAITEIRELKQVAESKKAVLKKRRVRFPKLKQA
jgi:hypothetical protein